MEQGIAYLAKSFRHLAREVQAYLFSGFIVLTNLFLLDYYYNAANVWGQIKESTIFLLGVFFIAYVIGQFTLAFYCLVLEATELDKKIEGFFFKKRFKGLQNFSDEETIEEKIRLIKTNPELYYHFIERDVILSLMRWNYSSAFVIVALINIGFCIFIHCDVYIIVSSLISIFIAFCFLVLHTYTQKENAHQMQKIKEIINL